MIIAYTRSAVFNEGEIEKQLEKIEKYASKKGLKIDHHFTDNGKSANDLKRPGLANTLRYIVTDKADTVIVDSIKTLCRNSTDLNRLIELIHSYHGKVIIVDLEEKEDE